MKTESSSTKDLRLLAGIILAVGGSFGAASFFSLPLVVEIVGGVIALTITVVIGRRALPPWRGSKAGQVLFLAYAFVLTAIAIVLSLIFGH
jgi:hypothetical protein